MVSTVQVTPPFEKCNFRFMPWQIFDGRKSKRTKALVHTRLSAQAQSQSVGGRHTQHARQSGRQQHFPNSKITNGAIEFCFGLLLLSSFKVPKILEFFFFKNIYINHQPWPCAMDKFFIFSKIKILSNFQITFLSLVG